MGICLACGNPLNKGHKYCSYSCANKSTAPKQISKACAFCSKPFSVRPCESHRKYCSKQCSTAGVASKSLNSAGERWDCCKIKNCAYCGRVFHEGNIGKRKYCSRACRVASRGPHYTKPLKKILMPCPNCKHVFLQYPWRKYCSILCYRQYRTSHAHPRVSQRHRYVGPRTFERTCVICSNPYFIQLRRPSDLRKGWHQRKTCSNGCNRKLRSQIHMGMSLSISARDKIRHARVLFPNKIHETTTIELALRNELTSRGVSFVVDVPMIICRPDIFLPSYRVVIFADGCYWHGCPEHFKTLKPFHAKALQRDRRQDEYLRKRGYAVYRFWEHDIRHSAKTCIDSILELSKPLSTTTQISTMES